MGMMKNYLLNLLQQCSEEQFGQDAIEWAVSSGKVRPTYQLERDVREVMSRYDEIIESYRAALSHGAAQPHTLRAPMQRAQARRRPAEEASSTTRKKRAA